MPEHAFLVTIGAMHLLHVIPISRGIAKERLTYLSNCERQPGTLVSVPIRNRTIPALVAESVPAKDAKAHIKTATYKLKRVTGTYTKSLFTPQFMEAAERIAFEHAASTGAVLHDLVPKTILEAPSKVSISGVRDEQELPSVASEKLVLQAPTERRAEVYRNLIREAFARNQSVFVCVPTSKDAGRLAEMLKKGISEYVFCITSATPKAQQYTLWKNITASTHPVVVFATPTFLSLPRLDWGTFIIEREQSRFFKMGTRPFLDMRIAVERIAEATRARCVFADQPVRTETYERLETQEADELDVPMRRSTNANVITLANPKETDSDEPTFAIFSEQLRRSLREVHAAGEHTFLYTARRGIAPTVVCNDCGTLVRCDSCGASVVLHSSNRDQTNRFRCHACGSERDAHERCSACRSWRLQELGIGAERVVKAVQEELGDTENVFELDADTARTHKQAERIAHSFVKTPGSILVGTDRAVPYLPAELGLAAIVSADAVLALPDFRGTERLLASALHLAELTNNCIVQSRAPETEVYDALRNGRLTDFHRSELSVRKMLHLPPYTVLIAIRHAPDRARCKKAVTQLTAAFGDNYSITSYMLEPRSGRRNRLAVTLLRVPRERWLDPALLEHLRGLPQECSVDVYAESIH